MAATEKLLHLLHGYGVIHEIIERLTICMGHASVIQAIMIYLECRDVQLLLCADKASLAQSVQMSVGLDCPVNPDSVTMPFS